MNTNSRRRLTDPTSLLCALLLSFPSLLPWVAEAQDASDRDQHEPPTLTVTGRGEAFAAPDRASIRLGAIAENKEAAKAQSQVNETMQRALKALRELKFPENRVKTAGLSLTPVYEQQERSPGVTRPRIVGYRAHNTLQLQVDDLSQIGQLVDAAVAAGANQIERLSFELKDDRETRRRALMLAAEEARAKANALATAMDLELRDRKSVV